MTHDTTTTLRICDLFDRIAVLRAAGVGVLAAVRQALREYEAEAEQEIAA